VGGDSPGEPSGDGATEALAEGAEDAWNRNTLAKSGSLKFFMVSDFSVSVFLSAGTLSICIGAGFFASRVDFMGLADFPDLTEVATDLGARGT